MALALVLTFVSFSCEARGEDLVLVSNGQPLATIVAGTETEKVEGGAIGAQTAASEIQLWVRLVSGAELPIAAEPPPRGPAILVGKVAESAGLDLAGVESRSREGIGVEVRGDRILVAGQRPLATYRAAARFLEEALACRWFAEPDWGRVHPRRATIRVRSDLSLRERPGFIVRNIWGAEGAFKDPRWRTWNGAGGIDAPMGHSWDFLTRDDFDAHPEWFRMNELGERDFGRWPNLGNAEVRRKFVEWAVRESEDGKKSISLSPPDDHRFDHSPEARRYDQPEEIDPTSGLVSMTNRFVGIADEAARAIRERGSEGLVHFYAYSDYTLPPTAPALAELSPNLAIWIAPIRYSRYHPLGDRRSPSQQALQRIVDGWAEHAAMIGLRTYNYNLAEVMTPYSKLSIWAHDLPYLFERGAIGVNLESFETWELSAPHLYLSVRLAYDPRLDAKAILRDYWQGFYGPAARPMEAYWTEIDRAFGELETESGGIHALHLVYTDARLARLIELLAAARRAARAGAKHADRIEVAERGLAGAIFYRRWYDAINRGDVALAAETIDLWLEHVAESVRRGHTNKHYGARYIERFLERNTTVALEAVAPGGRTAKRSLHVLPDVWKFAKDRELVKAGVTEPPTAAEFDDGDWREVKTWSATLDQQRIEDHFGHLWYRARLEVPRDLRPLELVFVKADRRVTLYIDGRRVNEKPVEAFGGAVIDVRDFLAPGRTSQLAVDVDHTQLTELALGGLVHPVYLIGEKEGAASD
jgi:hypothetical protein